MICRWTTPCVGCDRLIEPGEQMMPATLGGWVHVFCNRQEAADQWLADALAGKPGAW